MAANSRRSIVAFVVVVLVLVAIIAFALPMWRTHQARERVTGALTAADGAKLAVLESTTIAGSLEKVKSADVGYHPPSTTNPYVAQVSVADGGVITVTTQDTGATPDPVLTLTPQAASTGSAASLTWTCKMVTGDARVAPAGCTAVATDLAPASTAMATSTMSPAAAATTR